MTTPPPPARGPRTGRPSNNPQRQAVKDWKKFTADRRAVPARIERLIKGSNPR